MSIDREVNIEKALVGLVAPLELCKQIPDGAFADSALVWLNRSLGWFVEERHEGYDIIFETYPAPTLAEIMAELTSNKLDVPAVSFDGDRWTAFYTYHNSGNPMAPCEDDNPATAALKLWLELKGCQK